MRIERFERRVARLAVTVSVFMGMAIFIAIDLLFGEWGLQTATVATLAFGAFALRYLIDQ